MTDGSGSRSVDVRKMREGDVPAAMSILDEWDMAPEPERADAERGTLRVENSFVAEDAGQVVGVSSYIVHSDTLAETASLAVDPDYRGRALATASRWPASRRCVREGSSGSGPRPIDRARSSGTSIGSATSGSGRPPRSTTSASATSTSGRYWNSTSFSGRSREVRGPRAGRPPDKRHTDERSTRVVDPTMASTRYSRSAVLPLPRGVHQPIPGRRQRVKGATSSCLRRCPFEALPRLHARWERSD